MANVKRTIKTNFINKVYYLPLCDYSTFWNNIKTVDGKQLLNGYEIISTDITDNMTLKVVTNERVETSKSVIYVKKDYENKSYNNYIDFINNTYIGLSYGIINRMYIGWRQKKDGTYIPSSNYESVKTIIQNGYNDNLIDDIKQVVYMTLFENLKNTSYYEYSFKSVILDSIDNFKIWDNNKCDFIQKDNDEINLYIACFRSVSKLLYNQKTKHDKINVMSIYDTDDNEQTYTVDSYAFKQALMDKTTKKAINNVNTICRNVMDYIKATEKPFIYNKCLKVMIKLQKGYTNKDIAKKLNMSKNSVTKYKYIIICAYNTLKKDYVWNMEKTEQTNNNSNYIQIDFNRINSTIKDNTINTIMYNSNKYYHNEKQALYNKLFNATPYSYNSMILRNRHNEKMYRKELQLDRQF